MLKNLNTFVFLLVLLVGSKGNLIALSDITLLFGIGLGLYLFIIREIKLDLFILIFVVAYIALQLIYYYKFGWLNFTSTTRAFLKIFYAYLTIKILKIEFFYLFEKWVYYLSIPCLFFFTFQLIHYETTFFIISLPEKILPFLDYRDSWYSNIIFFTINDNAPFRNSGWAWEPKGYANMLVLAAMFNLMINKFKFNKRFFIITLALLTTISTAGFLTYLFCVLSFWLLNKKAVLSFALMPFFLIVVILVFQLDFVGKKIQNEIFTSWRFIEYIDEETSAKTRSLGRFGSFIIDLYDFKQNPMVGVGMQESERTQGVHTRLVRVNGFSNTLSRFGILGIGFLILSLWLSFRALGRHFGTKHNYLGILAILMISFGSALTLNPLFLCIQIFGFTYKPERVVENV